MMFIIGVFTICSGSSAAAGALSITCEHNLIIIIVQIIIIIIIIV